MSKKIIVMKPGFDASDPDPRHQRFNGDLESLTYFEEGSITLTGAAPDAQTEISHNLGYIPFFVSYAGELTSGGGDYSQVPVFFADFTSFFFCSVWADANKLYFRMEHNLASSVTITFYYKIFRNNTGL